MFKKVKQQTTEGKITTNSIKTVEEPRVNIYRRIIQGKLYDTSKADKICVVYLDSSKIPEYDFIAYNIGGEKVTIYKGITEWFIEFYGRIAVVSEQWVKEVLGKYDVEKYIECFGEVELA